MIMYLEFPARIMLYTVVLASPVLDIVFQTLPEVPLNSGPPLAVREIFKAPICMEFDPCILPKMLRP